MMSKTISFQSPGLDSYLIVSSGNQQAAVSLAHKPKEEVKFKQSCTVTLMIFNVLKKEEERMAQIWQSNALP